MLADLESASDAAICICYSLHIIYSDVLIPDDRVTRRASLTTAVTMSFVLVCPSRVRGFFAASFGGVSSAALLVGFLGGVLVGVVTMTS